MASIAGQQASAQDGGARVAFIGQAASRVEALEIYDRIVALLGPDRLARPPFDAIQPFVHGINQDGGGQDLKLQIGPSMDAARAQRICDELRGLGHTSCEVVSPFALAGRPAGFFGELMLDDLPLSEQTDQWKKVTVSEFGLVDGEARVWTVPRGTKTDGATIPRLAWSLVGEPFTPEFLRAALIHDHYINTRHRSWADTHKVFHEALLLDRVSAFKAMIMFAAVDNYGPRWTIGQSLCWGTCACDNAFVEEATVTPVPDATVMARIRELVAARPNITRAEIAAAVDRLAPERKARVRAVIHDDRNCEGRPPQRFVVDTDDLPNWRSIGSGGSIVPKPQFKVVGVASNDTLNIRSAPSPSAAIVGTIPHDARNVATTGRCGDWCPISYDGLAGYASARFLSFDPERSRRRSLKETLRD